MEWGKGGMHRRGALLQEIRLPGEEEIAEMGDTRFLKAFASLKCNVRIKKKKGGG